LQAKRQNNSWYAVTERLLAKYLWTQERLARLRDIEQTITENVGELQKSLDEGKRIPGFTAKYGLAPGGSRGDDNDYSKLMVEYERQVDHLTEEILFQRRRLVRIKIRIAGIREKTGQFDFIMSRLTAEERHILDLRHIYKQSNAAIAMQYKCSEGTIRNRQIKIVQFVHSWLHFSGKKIDYEKNT
jgi:hypothetical protein